LHPLLGVRAERFRVPRLPVFVSIGNQKKVRRILVHHVNAEGEPLAQSENHIGLARVTDQHAVSQQGRQRACYSGEVSVISPLRAGPFSPLF
jgi:hypothetical protein